MHSDEFALIMIKPDALERGIDSEIFDGLIAEGLDVAKIGTIQFDLQFVMDFYRWSEIEYPDMMQAYICVTPLPVWIAKGEDAVFKSMALKNRLRAKYCDGPMKNLFHCPCSQEESQWQYNLLKERYEHMETPKKRTKNQVEAIVFKILQNGKLSFLMLKRIPERGGFWQPVTGNVEEGEAFEAAALREVREELGIETIIQLIDTNYSYEFTDNGMDQFERIFGVHVLVDQAITLSSEHSEYVWASMDEALNVYLKYPGNKEGLRRLCEKVKQKGGINESIA